MWELDRAPRPLLAARAAPQGARALADLHHLPLVDLRSEHVDKDAADAIPYYVLLLATAIPYRVDGERLKVALADPGDVHAIDALRLAARHALEFGVAAREEI